MIDWSSPTFIASQVLVLIGLLLFSLSFLADTRKKQLSISIMGNSANAVGYFLLGGFVGTGMNLSAITRDVVSGIAYRRRPAATKNKILPVDYAWLALWIAIATIAAAFTATGFFSLFAYLATVVNTIAIWQKNLFVFRLLGILGILLWLVYYVLIGNVAGLVVRPLMLAFVVASLIKYRRKA